MSLSLKFILFILGFFYAPTMKWPGAYSVTPRHSVTPSFRHSIIGFGSLSLERLYTFNSNLVYGYILKL
jgi:hypothetical protein